MQISKATVRNLTVFPRKPKKKKNLYIHSMFREFCLIKENVVCWAWATIVTHSVQDPFSSVNDTTCDCKQNHWNKILNKKFKKNNIPIYAVWSLENSCIGKLCTNLLSWRLYFLIRCNNIPTRTITTTVNQVKSMYNM